MFTRSEPGPITSKHIQSRTRSWQAHLQRIRSYHLTRECSGRKHKMGTTSLMETMTLSSIVNAHACCIFVTLRSKMLHCNTKRPGRVSCKTNFIFQPLGYINMVEMEIQLQPFLSVVPHPPATSLPNTQFIYHLSLTTVNHQHVLNTQATRVAMQTHVRPSQSLQMTFQTQQH